MSFFLLCERNYTTLKPSNQQCFVILSQNERKRDLSNSKMTISGCMVRHWSAEQSNLTKNCVKAFANIFCQEAKYAITISL